MKKDCDLFWEEEKTFLEKKEKPGNQDFLRFPTMFSKKASFSLI